MNTKLCNFLLFILLAIGLIVVMVGCEKKCNCETIQEAVKLLEHCDSVTVEARQYSYGDNDSIEFEKSWVPGETEPGYAGPYPKEKLTKKELNNEKHK